MKEHLAWNFVTIHVTSPVYEDWQSSVELANECSATPPQPISLHLASVYVMHCQLEPICRQWHLMMPLCHCCSPSSHRKAQTHHAIEATYHSMLRVVRLTWPITTTVKSSGVKWVKWTVMWMKNDRNGPDLRH